MEGEEVYSEIHGMHGLSMLVPIAPPEVISGGYLPRCWLNCLTTKRLALVAVHVAVSHRTTVTYDPLKRHSAVNAPNPP